jgi:hypothetical protein
MLRLALMALAVIVFSTGCSRLVDNQADGRQAGGERQTIAAGTPAPAQPPRTRLVGSMINLFKGTQVHNQQADRNVNNSLLEADEKLQGVLGENSRRRILDANNKPPSPIVPVQPPPPNNGAVAVPLISDAPVSNEAKAAGAGEKPAAAQPRPMN